MVLCRALSSSSLLCGLSQVRVDKVFATNCWESGVSSCTDRTVVGCCISVSRSLCYNVLQQFVLASCVMLAFTATRTNRINLHNKHRQCTSSWLQRTDVWHTRSAIDGWQQTTEQIASGTQSTPDTQHVPTQITTEGHSMHVIPAVPSQPPMLQDPTHVLTNQLLDQLLSLG